MSSLTKKFGIFNSKSTEQKRDSSDDDIDFSEIAYLVLDEISLFLFNLDVSNQFASNLLTYLANLKGIDSDLLIKLLQKFESKKNRDLKRKFKSW